MFLEKDVKKAFDSIYQDSLAGQIEHDVGVTGGRPCLGRPPPREQHRDLFWGCKSPVTSVECSQARISKQSYRLRANRVQLQEARYALERAALVAGGLDSSPNYMSE